MTNQHEKTSFIRRALRRLAMLDPGYRKAAFLEQKIDRLYPELLSAIAAVRPADRTDELKADIFRNLQEYHEHLNNVQAELKDRIISSVADLFKNDIRCRWQILDALDDIRFPPTMPVKCLICNHEAPKSTYETRVSNCIFGGGRLERFVCPECGCIFGPLKMMAFGEGQLSSEYAQHYRVYSEGDSKWKEIAAFRELNPRKDGRYLNFGAGAWSKSTQKLRAEGWDVYDYEPYAPEDANPWVLRSYDQLQALMFDGVFSNDVLEHFKDPIFEIAKMKTILLPRGKMVHCTGCYEYAYEYTRFHYVFFTGKSLQYVGDKTGFDVKLGERLKSDEPARMCEFIPCTEISDAR